MGIALYGYDILGQHCLSQSVPVPPFGEIDANGLGATAGVSVSIRFRPTDPEITTAKIVGPYGETTGRDQDA